jgi:hypothetical protein
MRNWTLIEVLAHLHTGLQRELIVLEERVCSPEEIASRARALREDFEGRKTLVWATCSNPDNETMWHPYLN